MYWSTRKIFIYFLVLEIMITSVNYKYRETYFNLEVTLNSLMSFSGELLDVQINFRNF